MIKKNKKNKFKLKNRNWKIIHKKLRSNKKNNKHIKMKHLLITLNKN